jgi:hypothetical protein
MPHICLLGHTECFTHILNMGPLSALGAPGRACEGFLTDGRSHRSQENFADLELLTKVIRKDIRS